MMTQTTCKISHCEATPTSGDYCERCAPSTPAIRYQTAEGCDRCKVDAYVPHYNCTCGANRAHCTSDYCYQIVTKQT